MSQFFTDLFASIFTPGPTPSLIVATNAAFACLQAVLLILLVATYSVHFLVLSFLSAGLWWAINWFVSELKAAQALEDAKKSAAISEVRSGDDSDTEAETVIETGGGPSSKDVEIIDNPGELKLRGSSHGNKSETSTEDEWERVSENEKDK
jgi:ER protein Pkr1